MAIENGQNPQDFTSSNGAHYAAAPQSQAPVAPQPYRADPQADRKKGGNGWKVALVVIIVLAVLTIIGMVSCSQAVRSFENDTMSLFGSADGYSASEPNTVGIIYLDGAIQYDGTSCSPEGLKKLLDQAANDNNISAVVLRVNSGGGTSTAGEEMSRLVREFPKPVVVSAASIDCSAAYMISSQANYLYTANSSEVGGIGTAMQVTDFSKLLKALGIDVSAIVSAESKDSSYGTRPLTEKERAYYQKMVDEINNQFIETVAQGRHMSKAQVKTLATGLPFVGKDAVRLGLFDAVGNLDDACAKASELAGHGSDYHTMTLTDSDTLDNLLSLLSKGKSGGGAGADDSSYSAADLAKALKELEKDGVQ